MRPQVRPAAVRRKSEIVVKTDRQTFLPRVRLNCGKLLVYLPLHPLVKNDPVGLLMAKHSHLGDFGSRYSSGQSGQIQTSGSRS